jgi:succinate dehydrogenase/fumarate reductase flavoprotein subunit
MLETDVLVVGGGGAGFRAAIAARESGVKVTLLSKGPLARCGATPMAGADFTMDGRSLGQFEGLRGDPNDSPEKVFNDVVTQGFFLNNQKLVEQYICSAPQRLRELIEWGIKITFSDERSIDTSGIDIMDALLRKARAIGVDLVEDVALLDLCTSDGMVNGGLGLDVRSGEFVSFRAKAVVIATGGWHKAFWPNTGARDLSGQGIAMAHRAGADLGNMEFITFCCNVFLDPPIWRGSIAPYILSCFVGGEGLQTMLTNSRGEQFLQNYDPYMVEKCGSTEWNKSFISYATINEVRAGRGLPHGGVWFRRGDASWEKVQEAASLAFPGWKYKAIDFSEWARKLQANEPVEVGSAVEYFEGGIVVDEGFHSTFQGLYAAGECTLGPFGANRVLSAITEMLVHGADAGANAAAYAKNTAVPSPDTEQLKSLRERAELPLRQTNGPKPAQLRRSVQEAAHKHLCPVRNKTELESFIDFLDTVRQQIPLLATTSKNRTYNKEWLDALELRDMVQLLDMAASCALARTESRGVHFREDFPYTDNDHWLRESIVKKVNESFSVTSRPVTVTAMTPPNGITPYLEFAKRMMETHSDTGGGH